jgi:hypothetical protein
MRLVKENEKVLRRGGEVGGASSWTSTNERR